MFWFSCIEITSVILLGLLIPYLNFNTEKATTMSTTVNATATVHFLDGSNLTVDLNYDNTLIVRGSMGPNNGARGILFTATDGKGYMVRIDAVKYIDMVGRR